jgi:hypothetical protein
MWGLRLRKRNNVRASGLFSGGFPSSRFFPTWGCRKGASGEHILDTCSLYSLLSAHCISIEDGGGDF